MDDEKKKGRRKREEERKRQKTRCEKKRLKFFIFGRLVTSK